VITVAFFASNRKFIRRVRAFSHYSLAAILYSRKVFIQLAVFEFRLFQFFLLIAVYF